MNATKLIDQIDQIVSDLRQLKGEQRSEEARYISIAITDLEHSAAILHRHLPQEEEEFELVLFYGEHQLVADLDTELSRDTATESYWYTSVSTLDGQTVKLLREFPDHGELRVKKAILRNDGFVAWEVTMIWKDCHVREAQTLGDKIVFNISFSIIMP